MQPDSHSPSTPVRGWNKRPWYVIGGLVLAAVALVLVDRWMRRRDPWTSTTHQCTTCGITRDGTDCGLPETFGWAGQLETGSTITQLLSEEYQERCTFHSWTLVARRTCYRNLEEGHPQPNNPATFASPEYLRKAIRAHPREMRCVFRLLLNPGARSEYALSGFIEKTFFPVFPEFRQDQPNPPPVDQKSHWPPAHSFPGVVQAWVEQHGGNWAELMSQ